MRGKARFWLLLVLAAAVLAGACLNAADLTQHFVEHAGHLRVHEGRVVAFDETG